MLFEVFALHAPFSYEFLRTHTTISIRPNNFVFSSVSSEIGAIYFEGVLSTMDCERLITLVEERNSLCDKKILNINK